MNVKTLCLGALCLTDATGYDIKKLFEAAFRHFHSASYGSIYPSLSQLERAGLIRVRVEPGARHIDRKVYSVTDAGRRAFEAELAATRPTEHLRSEFLALMFFAHLLPTPRLAALLDEVCADYRETLSYLESIRTHPGHTPGICFTIEMGIATLRAKLDFIASRREALLSEHEARTETSGADIS
jgi:DNA-binding PadR family transcriptional regulator